MDKFKEICKDIRINIFNRKAVNGLEKFAGLCSRARIGRSRLTDSANVF